MKRKLILVLFTLAVFNLLLPAQEYPKAILPGDYADPTILRDGNDYYMTHSPFVYMPGFLIWHSQDLMNWQPLTRIKTPITGSAYAPDLIKHNNKYYIYYPAKGTNWVIWADDILGPWSNPIDLKVGLIDPGHIVGEDGKRYLHLSKGQMVELADDGLSVVGESFKVYDGWQYPKEWVVECFCLESPKMKYKDGYYYMTSAQGGTAGPATSHMVVSARSKSAKGPWENSPYNPIVHTYHESENWWSKGHGTIVDDVNGNWWIVYHAYAKGYHTLGRQTLIEPIEWTSDGWFRTTSKATPIIPKKQIKNGMELSDNFSGKELGMQWTFWNEDVPNAVSIKNNTLSLQGKGTTPANGRKLLTTATDKTYEIQVEVEVENQNQAGLILYYNERAFAGVISDGKTFTLYADAENSKNVVNKYGKRFFLKILNQGNNCTFSASKDGRTWEVLAQNVEVSGLNHNKYRGFYALRPGLVALGKGKSNFKKFSHYCPKKFSQT